MQAAVTFTVPPLPLAPARQASQLLTSHPPKLTGTLSQRFSPIKVASGSSETSTVDYSSQSSVFPAEACETIGGDACLADIYPEAKLQPQSTKKEPRNESENVDRDYLEYNDEKTVFPGEACDDLGGLFCEPDYQRGVY